MKLTLIFDGGARPTNPGNGYGSFQVSDEQGVAKIVQKEYGSPITNNQAEWMTLEQGLLDITGERGFSGYELLVKGDSSLVINGAARLWKVRHPNLRPIADRVWALCDKMASVSFVWHPRSHSVVILGH